MKINIQIQISFVILNCKLMVGHWITQAIQNNDTRVRFAAQAFIYKLQKLSNNGWSAHERILGLEDAVLRYYSKVPKRFQNSMSNRIEDVGKKAKAKESIKLSNIKSIQVVDEKDTKKRKKLRPHLDKAFKILFVKEKGAVASESDDDVEEDGEDEEEKASSDEEGSAQNAQLPITRALTSHMSKSKGQRLGQWFFICADEQERTEVMSKIYMNAKNKSNLRASKGDLVFLSDDKEMLEILNEFIESQELEGIEVQLFNQRKPTADSKPSSVLDDSPERETEELSSLRTSQGLEDQDFENEYQKQHYNNKKGPENEAGRHKAKAFGLKDGLMSTDLNNPDLDPFLGADMEVHDKRIGQGNAIHDRASERQIKLLNEQIYEYNRMQAYDTAQKERETRAWDLKFQNYWGYSIAADSNYDESLAMCERLFKHVGQFREHVANHVKSIVDSMHRIHTDDSEVRQHIPLSYAELSDEQQVLIDESDDILYRTGSGKREVLQGLRDQAEGRSSDIHQINPNENSTLTNGQFKPQFSSSYIYVDRNILYKFAHKDELIYTVSRDGSLNSHPSRLVGHGEDGQDLKEMEKWKFYGRQFSSMDTMFEALYLLSRHDAEYKLRIPISALVDYKGFRCLAIGQVPISTKKGPILGFYQGTYIQTEPELKSTFMNIGEALNLKENENRTSNDNKNEDIPVSSFIQVYDFSKPRASENELAQAHGKDRKSYSGEGVYMEKPLYVVKTSEIFPIDCEQTNPNRLEKNIQNCLRPEFFNQYESEIEADTLKDFKGQYHNEMAASDGSELKEEAEDDSIASSALSNVSNFLRTRVISKFVTMLDELQILPIDHESLTAAFHEYGINMRYLSYVMVTSKARHVKDICLNEILARTCKNILNSSLSSLILDNKRDYDRNVILLQQRERQIREREKFQSENTSKMSKRKEMNEQNILFDIIELRTQRDEAAQQIQKCQTGDIATETKESIVDMLNLIFGHGQETDYFWEYLIEECKQQFQIAEAMKYNHILGEIDEFITKDKVNLIALFYAFKSLIGLRIDPVLASFAKGYHQRGKSSKSQNELKGQRPAMAAGLKEQHMPKMYKEFFSKFGKDEKPFGEPAEVRDNFEFQAKSRTYQLQNIPYKKLFDRHRKYQSQRKIDEALECLKMKKEMDFALSGEIKIDSLADIAEVALQQDQFALAIKYAEQGLELILPMHAQNVRFYCILMRAHNGLDNFDECEKFFQLSTEILYHHLGQSHPLHVTVYSLMSYLLIPKGKFEEALYLYKSALLCSQRALGSYHIQTAETQMNFGQFYLRWDKRDNALQQFEQAFLIYDNYFTNKQRETKSVLVADAAMQVANIMEEQNRMQEAYDFVSIARDKYKDIYGDASDNTIIAQWLKLQIAYTNSNGMVDSTTSTSSVVDSADTLFKSLCKRDENFKATYEQHLRDNFDIEEETVQELKSDHHYYVDEMKTEMDKIKIMCIATHIMEMTRILSNKEKELMERYCKKLLDTALLAAEVDDSVVSYANLIEQKNKHIDLLSVKKVSGLIFSAEAEAWLLRLFHETKEQSFKEFYHEMISNAATYESDARSQARGAPGYSTSTARNAKNLADTHKFFTQLLYRFQSINFFNLLHWQAYPIRYIARNQQSQYQQSQNEQY